MELIRFHCEHIQPHIQIKSDSFRLFTSYLNQFRNVGQSFLVQVNNKKKGRKNRIGGDSQNHPIYPSVMKSNSWMQT